MFKVLTKGCKPTRGSKYSACVDLYASEDVVIGAGETKIIGLGVSIDEDELFKKVHDTHRTLQEALYILSKKQDKVRTPSSLMNDWKNFMSSHYLQLMLRSSLGKKCLILPNGVGIIDLDYKDEIKIIIHNPLYDTQSITTDDFNTSYHISKGDKIAQITLLEHKGYLFGINTDKERDGGFGSTGR